MITISEISVRVGSGLSLFVTIFPCLKILNFPYTCNPIFFCLCVIFCLFECTARRKNEVMWVVPPWKFQICIGTL
jgi:hypothetical protein